MRRYRELIRRLTLKDLKLRYKGSVFGFLWSLINPLLMSAVFYMVFNVLLPSPVDRHCLVLPSPCDTATYQQAYRQGFIHDHFIVYIFIAVLAWNFTSAAAATGTTVLLGNAGMIKKVYMPSAVFPIATVLALFVNYLLAYVVIFALILITGVPLSGLLLLLPVLMVFHVLFACGLALFLSSATVHFRDLTVIIDVLLLAWFFLTPVFYDMTQVYNKDIAGIVYWLNPMASFIESYRAILFFSYPPEPLFMLRTCLSGLITFIVGFVFFVFTTRSLGEKL